MRIEESIICKLVMGLFELEPIFEYPNCLKEEYIIDKNGDKYLSSITQLDERGRIKTTESFNNDGAKHGWWKLSYPEKNTQVADFFDKHGNVDIITKQFNKEQKLTYESFQYGGFYGSKDELFIRYRRDGTIWFISEQEPFLKGLIVQNGYQFEYLNGKLNRIYHGNEVEKDIVK